MGTLVGRAAEAGALDDLLGAVRDGRSGVLVLRGEAGIGKTALLEHAAKCAGEMRVTWVAAVEPEADLGFALLHTMLVPFLGGLERLPGPQRQALGSAFGLTAGAAPDRFLVGLGVLTLLTDAAADQPVLCLVDDAQWADRASAEALGFVARRLLADRVGMIFAVREAQERAALLEGLPKLPVAGLPDDAATELLTAVTGGRVNPLVGHRIVAAAGGNPLALAEFAGELADAEISGEVLLCEPLRFGRRLEELYLSRVRALPAAAQMLLLVAAADQVGDPAKVWRAAAQLGVGLEAAELPAVERLLSLAPRVQFRHPLMRSAVYYGAPSPARRRAHEALAAVSDPDRDQDRRAWHLGQAALGPDEQVAAELARSADRTRGRGGWASSAVFLERSAKLTPDAGHRASRLLAAAEAALLAGQPDTARALLDEAMPGLAGTADGARALLLQGTIGFAVGQAGEAAPILLAAARALPPADPQGARQALLAALEAALYAGWSASRTVLSEIAAAAHALPRAGGPEASASDLLLDGFAARVTAGYRESVPLLRRAIAVLGTGELSPQQGLRQLVLGCVAAAELFDDQAQHVLAIRLVKLARDYGALTVLPVALNTQIAFAEVPAGRFDAARACAAEALEILAATGNPGITGTAGIGEVYELAWRGREADAHRIAAAIAREAGDVGRDAHPVWVDKCLAVLELGLGDYPAALRCALPVYADDAPFTGTLVLPDLVEAAAGCEETRVADAALGRLAERAVAAGTPLGLGLLARSRALVATGEDAEESYREAIAHLKRCRTVPELARAHLVYGEWLRRQRRRRGAREQLRTAYEMFARLGAEAFAERARTALAAVGEHTATRDAATPDVLTPQEAQIARLAADGASNREIAARLFISASTVDYHLHKVFRKLGVASRVQLPHVLREPDRLADTAPVTSRGTDGRRPGPNVALS
jgi:DNA-binding CsgD family transcriptional regulator